jgi:transcriptional regulator with XRE-family HTH domain
MKRLTKLRQERKQTRAALGADAQVHPSHVGAIENGRLVPAPDSVILRRLASALRWGGDPAALLEEVE